MSGYRSILVRALSALPENTGVSRSVVYQRARISLNRQLNSRGLQLSEAQMNALRMELENSIREVESEAENIERERGEVEKKLPKSRLIYENLEIHNPVLQNTNITEDKPFSNGQQNSADLLVNPELSRNKWKIQDIPGFQEERESRRHLKSSTQSKKTRKLIFTLLTAIILLAFASYSLWDELVLFLKSDRITGIELAQRQIDSGSASNSQVSLQNSSLESNSIESESLSSQYSAEEIFDGEVGRIFFKDESGSTTSSVDGFVIWTVQNDLASVNEEDSATFATANFIADSVDLNVSFQSRIVDETSAVIQMDVIFNMFDNSDFSNINKIQGIVVNSFPESLGDTMSGESVKIADNHYRITLSDTYHACNIILLKERNLINIPIVLENDRRIVVQLEKGDGGQSSFDSIYSDWQNRGVASYSQCSMLYEESEDSGEAGLNFIGEAVWYTELKKTESGKEVTILKADANFEDKGLKASISIMPEEDSDLDANHLVEIRFRLSEKFHNGGISSVKGLYMKPEQDSQGGPLLTSASAKVFRNYFWVVLSPVPTEEEQNFNLLSSLDWLEVQMGYENGKQAVISFNKGLLGREVVHSAISTWKVR